MWFWEIILQKNLNLLFIYLTNSHNEKLPGVKLLRVWDYGFSQNPQRLFNKNILNCLPTHCIGFSPVKIMTHWSVGFFFGIYHLHEGWMKVGSQTFPKLKEGEREIFRWYAMHDALPMFIFEWFLLRFQQGKRGCERSFIIIIL
jgi:hypothetical protein